MSYGWCAFRSFFGLALALTGCAEKAASVEEADGYRLQALFACEAAPQGDLLYFVADVQPDPAPDEVYATVDERIQPLSYDEVDEAWFAEQSAADWGLGCSDVGEAAATFAVIDDGALVVGSVETLEPADLPEAG